MNDIHTSIRGNVTSDPRQIRFDDGNIVTSFRLACNSKRFDSQSREWVTTGTTFMNVNCRRGLAVNVANSVSKGQPVVVSGKLRERLWEANGRSGRSLEIEAEAVGHDLNWGTSDFERVVRAEQVRRPEDEQGDAMAAELDRAGEEERQADDLDAAEAGALDHLGDEFGDGIMVDPETGELREGYGEAVGRQRESHLSAAV